MSISVAQASSFLTPIATPVNLVVRDESQSRSDYCELWLLHFHGLPHRLCSWHRGGRLANAKEDGVEHRHDDQGQDGSKHQPEDDTHRHSPEKRVRQEYRKIKWPFPPTTSPPHTGVGPYAPRCPPWRTPCQGGAWGRRGCTAGAAPPGGPDPKRGERAVEERGAMRTAQPWGQAAKNSRATYNVVSLLSQRVAMEGHFRPASGLDGDVMLVKFFQARDCLLYDKTRGTLHVRPGARGPQAFRGCPLRESTHVA
jgi:hypothetical protein